MERVVENTYRVSSFQVIHSRYSLVFMQQRNGAFLTALGAANLVNLLRSTGNNSVVLYCATLLQLSSAKLWYIDWGADYCSREEGV